MSVSSTPLASIYPFAAGQVYTSNSSTNDIAQSADEVTDWDYRVALKNLADVNETSIDPRLDLSVQPTEEQLDEPLSLQLSNLVSRQKTRSSEDQEPGEQETPEKLVVEPVYVSHVNL